MKKSILVLLFLISYLTSTAKIPDAIIETLQKQFVFCEIAYRSPNGDLRRTYGGGFIINHRYFATCDHVFKMDGNPNDQMLSFEVIYNMHSNQAGTQMLHDSVFVDTHYKYSKRQFDFTKLRKENPGSDFIILKLKHKINNVSVVFSKGLIEGPTYTMGLAMPDGIHPLTLEISSNTIMYFLNISKNRFYASDPLTKDPFLVAILGNLHKGLSGSPVLNAKGEVMGMIELGESKISIERLNSVRAANCITEAQYNQVVTGYNKGMAIALFVNIRFLTHNYINGFL